MVGGWSDKTKVILNLTQFKFKLVEVGVELGNAQGRSNDALNYNRTPYLNFFLILELGIRR